MLLNVRAKKNLVWSIDLAGRGLVDRY
jgi:hypothetical protein